MTEAELLKAALIEVLVWIDSWDPNFIYDDAWPATRDRVQKALHTKEQSKPNLADEFQAIVAAKLAKMEVEGVQWSAERQAEYNEACRQFYLTSIANDKAAMFAALVITRRMEAEGGLL